MAMIRSHTLRDGSLRWKAVIRRKGMPKRSRTFRTQAKAKAWAKGVEVGILDGRVPPDAAEERRTVDDLIHDSVRQVEGFSKHVGEERLPWWSAVERKLDPKAKLLVIAHQLGVQVDLGSEPWQSFSRAFKARNLMGHPRTEVIDPEPYEVDVEELDLDLPRNSELEELTSIESAEWLLIQTITCS